MRKMLILATLATLGAATAPAVAADAERGCQQGPQANAISADALKARIAGFGYDVSSLMGDDGFYNTHIVDRGTGGVVRAIFSAATGELVRASLVAR